MIQEKKKKIEVIDETTKNSLTIVKNEKQILHDKTMIIWLVTHKNMKIETELLK